MAEEDDRRKKQKRRSLAIAIALAGLAVMFFVITVFRLGGNVVNRPM